MEFEGRARIETRLDMAPLVDVVFLLLIFFLLTSSYITPQAIEVRLPESSTAVPLDDEPTVVSLLAGGEVQLNGTPVTKDELAARLRARPADGSSAVVLQADAQVEVEALVGLLDVLRTAGAHDVSIMTARPERQ